MQIYPYQQECLNAIESARQTGSKKALVVMATGLGKTVVSALQLKRMLAEKPGRVLYVTHQNEILRQARRTYETLLPPEMTYGYFHGEEKHLHKVDVLFASFQAMVTSRELFARDEFTYVVVDEAHHVHAETYRPTVEYFQPDLMIGLTATPDRADRKDITELMGEPVFHLDLFEALAGRHLTPINYRLMTDELQNLEVLETPVGKLSIAELNRTIFVPKRDEEIVRIIEEKLDEVANPRTILFCSSVAHAEQLGELMPYAQVLHSKLKPEQRERRIKAFRNGHSRIIITVDMFNEGIDIPEANVVVFLRSTASQTIYLQQLGRGLRRAESKDEVLVLDFVANCERVEMISALQEGIAKATGDSGEKDDPKPTLHSVFDLTIDGGEFDERLVDLISFIKRARQSYTKEELTHLLLDFAQTLGRSPSSADVLLNPDMPSPGTYVFVFGKPWNDILRGVGLPPTSRWTKAELASYLLAFAEELGRTPSTAEVDANPNLPNRKAFENAFGKSWNGVVEEVGLTPIRQHVYTKEELTEQILSFVRRTGRAPTKEEVRKDPSMANPKAFLNIFGSSWVGMIEALGLTHTHRNTPYSKDELTGQFLSLVSDMGGKIPTAGDISASTKTASVTAFTRAFQKPWSEVRRDLSQLVTSQNN